MSAFQIPDVDVDDIGDITECGDKTKGMNQYTTKKEKENFNCPQTNVPEGMWGKNQIVQPKIQIIAKMFS